MSPSLHTTTSRAVFDREWPSLRARLLDLASSLDRIDRAPGPEADESPRQQITQAIRLLLEPGKADRAERILAHFSREYVADWRQRFAKGALAAESNEEEKP